MSIKKPRQVITNGLVPVGALVNKPRTYKLPTAPFTPRSALQNVIGIQPRFSRIMAGVQATRVPVER